MAKRGFLGKHGIVRNDIKNDILYFGISAIIVFTGGLLVCAWEGWIGPGAIESQEGEPQSLFMNPVCNLIGGFLVFAGLSIMILVQITLGRSYSSTLVIKKDLQLITYGVYRFLRHPIYPGMMVVSVGISVFSSRLNGFLILQLLIPIILNRIRMEEKLLIDEFGDMYRKYK